MKNKNLNIKKSLCRGFTLLEMLFALIIVSVLVSLSLVSYQKAMEVNNDRICRLNEAVLQAAAEIYVLEGNSLPITVSQLTDRQIHLAYLKVVGLYPENKFLAFLNNILGVKPAIAGDLTQKYYGDRKVLHCPADKTAQEISYEFNSDFATIGDFDTKTVRALIYDNDSTTGHKKGLLFTTRYAIGISPDGITDEVAVDSGIKKVKKVKNLIARISGGSPVILSQIKTAIDAFSSTEDKAMLTKIYTKKKLRSMNPIPSDPETMSDNSSPSVAASLNNVSDDYLERH